MSDATLLPPSSSALERALDLAAAERLAALSAEIPDLWSVERCPVPLLGHLAWSLSVDDWDDAWSEDVKRAVIRASIPVHRRKGTPGAVRDAIGAITGAAAVTEWWQYAGPRHTFRLAIPPFDRPGRLGEIVRAIGHAKPAHAHLDLLTMRRELSGRVTVGGVMQHVRKTALRHDPLPRVPPGRVRFGGVLQAVRTTHLGPFRGPPTVPSGRPAIGGVMQIMRTTILQPAGFATPARNHPDQVYAGGDPVSSGSTYVRSTT